VTQARPAKQTGPRGDALRHRETAGERKKVLRPRIVRRDIRKTDVLKRLKRGGGASFVINSTGAGKRGTVKSALSLQE